MEISYINKIKKETKTEIITISSDILSLTNYIELISSIK